MTLRRLLEARMGKQGKREFVQVLRLMEVFRADGVAAAVRDSIRRGAIGSDAVKHLVLCRIERRPPRLDMTVYPYLPQAHVAMTSAKTYLGLLTGAAVHQRPETRRLVPHASAPWDAHQFTRPPFHCAGLLVANADATCAKLRLQRSRKNASVVAPSIAT